MRLSDMLSNIFNQNTVSAKGDSAFQMQTISPDLATKIQALMPGQILKGEVLECNGDLVKLLMHLDGENVPLQARIEQNLMVNIGKTMMFQVKNNASSLSLMPLYENIGMKENAMKALQTASLSVDASSLEMTVALMKEGISIDKNTLQEIYHHMISNENADLTDIIDLYKLHLPINGENVEQMHSYKELTHQISGGVQQLSNDLLFLLEHMADIQGMDSVENFLRKMFGVKDVSIDATVQNPSGDKNVITEFSPKEALIIGETEDKSIQNLLSNEITQEENLEKTSLVKSMDTDKLLQDIFLKLQQEKEGKQTDSQLLKEVGFRNGVRELLQRQLLLEPENTQKENVKKLYDHLNKHLQIISNALEQTGQEQSSLAKTVQNMNQNIRFLNQVNQMYAYIQLPLKLSESNTHGELYVYSNKKHIASPEGNISALLHLDMDYLGPLDVYVQMKEFKVNTDFYLADESMLDFLYEHMDLLTKRLEKRGYQLSYELKLRNEEDAGKNVAMQELIRENSNIPTMVHYSFDVRA